MLKAITSAQLSVQYLLACNTTLKNRKKIISKALNTFDCEEEALDLELARLRARERAMARECQEYDNLQNQYLELLNDLDPTIAKKYKRKLQRKTELNDKYAQKLDRRKDAWLLEHQEDEIPIELDYQTKDQKYRQSEDVKLHQKHKTFEERLRSRKSLHPFYKNEPNNNKNEDENENNLQNEEDDESFVQVYSKNDITNGLNETKHDDDEDDDEDDDQNSIVSNTAGKNKSKSPINLGKIVNDSINVTKQRFNQNSETKDSKLLLTQTNASSTMVMSTDSLDFGSNKNKSEAKMSTNNNNNNNNKSSKGLPPLHESTSTSNIIAQNKNTTNPKSPTKQIQESKFNESLQIEELDEFSENDPDDVIIPFDDNSTSNNIVTQKVISKSNVTIQPNNKNRIEIPTQTVIQPTIEPIVEPIIEPIVEPSRIRVPKVISVSSNRNNIIEVTKSSPELQHNDMIDIEAIKASSNGILSRQERQRDHDDLFERPININNANNTYESSKSFQKTNNSVFIDSLDKPINRITKNEIEIESFDDNNDNTSEFISPRAGVLNYLNRKTYQTNNDNFNSTNNSNNNNNNINNNEIKSLPKVNKSYDDQQDDVLIGTVRMYRPDLNYSNSGSQSFNDTSLKLDSYNDYESDDDPMIRSGSSMRTSKKIIVQNESIIDTTQNDTTIDVEPYSEMSLSIDQEILANNTCKNLRLSLLSFDCVYIDW